MDRRSFHKAVGLSILGAGAIGPARAWTAPDGGREAVRRRAGEDHKAWARKHFRGMENLFLPSFTADFAQLDEEGIRADVRQAARQGFFSTLPVNLGLKSRDESRRLLEIVADEARGKILVTAGAGGRTFDEQVDGLRFAERAGASQIFMSLQRAETEAQIVTTARRLIEATDLPIVLYGQPDDEFMRFHPSGLPLDAFDRLASLPNVIAVKFTQVMNLATAYELAARVSDRLLIGPVHLEAVPLLASRHHVQWSGQWTVEALQSPERPYGVEFIDHIGNGRMKEALEKYLDPASCVSGLLRAAGSASPPGRAPVVPPEVLSVADGRQWRSAQGSRRERRSGCRRSMRLAAAPSARSSRPWASARSISRTKRSWSETPPTSAGPGFGISRAPRST